MTTILVCGGRYFGSVPPGVHDDELLSARRLAGAQRKVVYDAMKDEMDDIFGHILVIHGDCPTGADSIARRFCEAFNVDQKRFPADWRTHGRSAGPRRNQKMIDEERPDVVLAFPGGAGTEDMVRRALKAGVRVKRIGD